jgi:DNA repair exonuclease SbcCD ATPase subunit
MGILSRLLAVIGLAPTAHVTRLNQELRSTSNKVREMEARLAKLRADSEGWKRRYDDAAKMATERKEAASRADAEAKRARADADRAAAAEWQARAKAQDDQLRELRARADDAQRAAALAREQLMVMETKLDLIEAAVQVLDTRTHTSPGTRS